MSTGIKVASAPDSWGVWFPFDPKQTPWHRFLDEVAAAGYTWTELGPRGFLPTDTAVLQGELARRGLSICGGTVIHHVEDTEALPRLESDIRESAAQLRALGATVIVLIDETSTNVFTGERLRPAALAPDAWRRLADHANRAGRVAREEGMVLTFHPHADTHVEYEAQVAQLLADTDPSLVGLCLDTGHHAYRGGDPVAFFRRHRDRIPYLHVKSVDARMMERVNREGIPFGKAVGMDMFVEPSQGVVDFPAFARALLETGYQGFAVVEQDMYPAPFDKPLPIAKRTRAYLREVGLG